MSERTEFEKLRDAARAASLLEPGTRVRHDLIWGSVCFLPIMFSTEPSGLPLLVFIGICFALGCTAIALWRNWRFSILALGLVYLVLGGWFTWTAVGLSPITRAFRFFPEIAIALYGFSLAWICLQANLTILRAGRAESQLEGSTVERWIAELETDSMTIPTNNFFLGEREFALLRRESYWLVRETVFRRTRKWTVGYSVYRAEEVSIDGGSPAYLVLGKRRIKGANVGTAEIVALHA